MKKIIIPTGIVVITIGVLLVSYRLWWQSYNIGAASMAPTLIQGDVVLARKTQVDTTYNRGDLILFRHADPVNEIYVKRVIAVAGDVVDFQGQELVLNNNALIRVPQEGSWSKSDIPRWLQGTTYLEQNYGRRYEILIVNSKEGPKGKITVPPDHYFVLGDNRNQSRDSRFIGPIPAAAVVGKPVLIWWSAISMPKRLIRWERIGRFVN